MVVRQIGGSGLLASPDVTGKPPVSNKVVDPAGGATYEALGIVSSNQPNMDILSASVSQPNARTLRVTMKVADLTTLAPAQATGNSDTVLVWNVQWLAPSSSEPNGSKNLFAYMQSIGGGAPTFWVGENAQSKPAAGRFISWTFRPACHRRGVFSYNVISVGRFRSVRPQMARAFAGAVSEESL